MSYTVTHRPSTGSHRRLLTAFALVASSMLSACGGGGGSGVNSASSVPGPVSSSALGSTTGPISLTSVTVTNRTPLPPTVATTAGTYDTVAWVSEHAFDQNGVETGQTKGIISPSPIRISVDPARPSFTVRAQLPDRQIEKTYVGTPNPRVVGGIISQEWNGDFGYRVEYTLSFSDGSKSEPQIRDITHFTIDRPAGIANPTEGAYFTTKIGQRYVSLGAWNLSEWVDDGTKRRQTRGTEALFVYGERTAPSDLPAGGTASYRDPDNILRLDADFGARTIAANVDYPAKVIHDSGYYGEDIVNVQVGVKASGSSAITQTADFSIPLAGTSLTPDAAEKLPVVIEPVTGRFVGAFFGPQAAEVGGIAEILKANGDPLWTAVPFLLEKK